MTARTMGSIASATQPARSAAAHERTAGVLLFTLAALFMTTIMLGASIAPGYDLGGGAISDLGVIDQTALLFNASLVAVGTLNLAAGAILFRATRRRSILVVSFVAGLGAAGAGVVPLDVSDLHGIFALLAFLFFNVEALVVATVVTGPMRIASWVAGLVGIGFVLLMVIGDAGNPGVFGAIGHGGAERMIVYPVMLWMLAFGGYLMATGPDRTMASLPGQVEPQPSGRESQRKASVKRDGAGQRSERSAHQPPFQRRRSGVDRPTARLSFAAVLIAALLAGCGPAASGPSSATPSPTLTPTPEPSREPIALAGHPMFRCTIGSAVARCGTLEVLENPADPGGRRIGIHVAVVPAVARAPEPDPVFMLAGGPGGAATDEFSWVPNVFAKIHATRDIVLVDQRGTGESNRLVAEGPDTTGMSEAEADETIRAWITATLAELPGDPRFYTTLLAMEDLDQVRDALGYEQINLYGPSYGATAAQYYLRQHDDRVRSVVLDGGTLLDVPVFERIAVNSQRALDILYTRCSADAACQGAYPGIRDEFSIVMERLAEQPATTPVPHPWTGDPLVIDAATFAGAVHTALVEDDVVGMIPVLVHGAYGGDFEPLADLVAQSIGPKEASTSFLVMSAVIRCSEAWARFERSEVERTGAGSYLLASELMGAENQALSCRYVPRGVVPADDASAVHSDVPTLLVLGDADPQNPPENVADASIELPNSRTVIVSGQAHTVGHLGCLPTVIAEFYAAGTPEGLDTACVDAMPPPPFDVP